MSPQAATTTDIMDFLREHMVTKEEFYVLAGRVGSVGGGLSKVEGKLTKVEGTLEKVENRLTKVEGKVDRLEGKIDVLEGKVDRLDGKVDRLEVKVDRLEDEVFGVKEQLGTFATKEDMDDMKGGILTVMDGFAKHQTTFEVELLALRNRFDRFEGFPSGAR